jgi:hypothetical protein
MVGCILVGSAHKIPHHDSLLLCPETGPFFQEWAGFFNHQLLLPL